MFASGKAAAVSSEANYIEDVFSTYLYTGNGSTQTITNGIDLSTKGGMLWLKRRDAAFDPRIWDTARGRAHSVATDLTDAQTTETASYGVTSFNSDGFSIGPASSTAPNLNEATYASWTFRKQPKFFDVVTWTGDDAADRQISHSLGSTPGCIIVKRTDASATWRVWHQNMVSNPANLYQYQLNLNNTNAVSLTYGEVWGTSNNVTSTTFQVGSLAAVNASGGTYVAYVFAHNAGGFGLTGTDNVISCGSFSTDGSGNATVSLGYEPQWLMYKCSSSVGDWEMVDVMRGWVVGVNNDNGLRANSSDAESAGSNRGEPSSTGFNCVSFPTNRDFIYIAIRRGPMKVPTSGTSVFSAQTGTYSTGDSLSVGFPADMYIDAWRTGTLYKANYSRLVNFANSNSSASQNYLKTNTTDAEVTTSQAPSLYDLWNTTAKVGSWNAGVSEVWWMFRRAPSFFDEVCYTGNGSTQTITHNLTVVPELIIAKNRGQAGNNWPVLFNFASTTMNYGFLNLTNSCPNDTYANVGVFSAAPTSTSMFLTNSSSMNASGYGIVAYLFATCAGVSKVGSYTGTGTTKQIDCGFTGGARFVLIKRTDSTGDWYVWDTARGIVSGNDPYLLLNSTAAEVTNTDYVDTYSAGFEISSTAPAAINASGGSFIFLAIS